jgi:hypothetical protein
LLMERSGSAQNNSGSRTPKNIRTVSYGSGTLLERK